MRRFRFRLETVLRVRKRQEESRKIELGRATGVLQVRKRRLGELEQALDRRCRELESRRVETLRVLELDMFYASIVRAVDRVRAQESLVCAAQKAVDECRERFLAARKARRLLEKLRARSLAAHATRVFREEAKILDEIGATFFQRAGEGGM